ncbi:MAG: sensor histidine kinase [Chloroflexi bacterium]|jgi:hypothetical protein|nr:sensor histidine kinase [Chloroflexota bacterium]
MIEAEDNQGNENGNVETYFAPAERAHGDVLQADIEIISQNPVIDTVMHVVGGFVAVLNEHRQILALNKTFLETLDIDNIDHTLGLRLGEAIHCIHACEQPGGCGTSQFCSTCGAAIAMVASLAHNTSEARECVATVRKEGKFVDLYFQVRCCPISFRGQQFLLLFLQDATLQQQQAALERAFFHDINNTIGALVLNSQLLNLQNDREKTSILAKRIKQLAVQLGKEVEIQSVLSHKRSHIYQVMPQRIAIEEMLQEIQGAFANHPVAVGKTLQRPQRTPDVQLVTDATLLRRILMNMLVNAFEATPSGGEVKLWVETSDQSVTFCVWNRQAIPSDVARRVFQRNFSTKAESGRGLGTYTMKLFGETYLGGTVGFTTSDAEGTVFRLCLPADLGANQNHA